MEVTSMYSMCQPNKNGTTHEETSSVKNHLIGKSFRIVNRAVMHLYEKLILKQLFGRAGFYQSLDFAQ